MIKKVVGMKPEKHWKPIDDLKPFDDEPAFGKDFVKRLSEIFFDEEDL
jgi:hypothetical protein